ncbi:MAG: iron-sulfur cluster repair di-iron protein [Flavobacteriaceae bacterium]|jgi:regulator of cell morphogenesis and NO signaling|nr:iron-sulfur cluster repair di-iron protein [Flavobacteriaceae bacterium]
MNIKTDFIGNIVADDFRTAAVFKQHKLDFCCKGARTIEDACKIKKIDPETVYREIESLPAKTENTIDFNGFPPDLLADYIEKTHHRYVEEKMPVIQSFLDKLCKVHGGEHPELFEIRDAFNESAKDLSAHLKKEELILFPFIRNMMKAKISGETVSQPAFGTVENPINMMMHEHSVEGDRFLKISELTSDYTPPTDVSCTTYRVTFAMLQEFENDLHKHIHLENNILFPKAVSLEKTFLN